MKRKEMLIPSEYYRRRNDLIRQARYDHNNARELGVNRGHFGVIVTILALYLATLAGSGNKTSDFSKISAAPHPTPTNITSHDSHFSIK